LNAPRPFEVIGEAIMTSLQTILCPTDFSDCSRSAFELASLLARQEGARLVILHVHAPLTPFVGFGKALARVEPSNQRDGLDKLLHRFRVDDPRIGVEYRMIEGDPASEIVRQAYLTECDLIVMGSHGRTGFKRLLLMGSVAEHVLRNAPCAVVTVRAPERAFPRPAPDVPYHTLVPSPVSG
jgi:nucleotide-binding universal stress UspA family protein